MAALTIRHVTTYRYRQPVAFGEHRMMFRPRETREQRVTAATLAIRPEPISLDFVHDDFGNHVGVARFSDRAAELRFESMVNVEQVANNGAGHDLGAASGTFPVSYGADETRDLASYRERRHPDAHNAVGRWASQFLPHGQPIGTFALLNLISDGIRHGFRYQRREAKGIQAPAETLRLGQGSCRDFAMLMIEAARALGFAARFASGYLATPRDEKPEAMNGSAGGSTHAWAQIHLPGPGWIDFDPTSGSIGPASLVTVAVVRDPDHAVPLHGTYIGQPSDHLAMDVHVSVTPGA